MQRTDGMQSNIVATVLAAGHGRRMGYVAKAAIRIDGLSLLHRQVSALREAGIADVSVVVGPYREHLEVLVSICQANLVVNESKSEDIVTSQLTALNSHVLKHGGCDLMVLLGDLPFLESHHILQICGLWEVRGKNIHALVPLVAGVRGHPVVLSWEAVKSIALSDLIQEGVRGWMSENKQAVQYVEMNDPAYVRDLDTQQDLAQISGAIELPGSEGS